MSTTHKIGRRKTSIARVYLAEGDGKITVNGKEYTDYFTTAVLQFKIQQAFKLTATENKYNVNVTVKGGGITGQAEAIRMAISRSLTAINEEYKPLLKAEDLLTRDPRMVERKKFGQKKARKRFQFSKR